MKWVGVLVGKTLKKIRTLLSVLNGEKIEFISLKFLYNFLFQFSCEFRFCYPNQSFREF